MCHFHPCYAVALTRGAVSEREGLVPVSEQAVSSILCDNKIISGSIGDRYFGMSADKGRQPWDASITPNLCPKPTEF